MIRSVLAAAIVFAVPQAAYATCSVSVVPIVFGRYDVLDPAPLDAVGRVEYACGSKVERVRIRILRSPGKAARAHALQNGTHELHYQLFLDPAMRRVWGDETDGTEALYVYDPPAGKTVSVPIFARLPPRQNVRIGTYTDSVTIQVDF